MKICRSIFIATAVTLSSISGAHADGEPGTGPNPFTDCGIGAALFPNTHWAAVTSNVIWDIGTTAIISATASPETCQGKKVEAALFIRDTYPNLIEETARGEGEHLTAMLQIFGCSAESHAQIISSVRTNIGDKVKSPVYSSMDGLAKAAEYYQVVDTSLEKAFAKSCSA